MISHAGLYRGVRLQMQLRIIACDRRKDGCDIGRSYVLGQRWEVPGTDENPTRGIARKPLNNARERFLSAEEAARLRGAVAASQNPQLQHIVGLLLLTGARVRELLDAR